MISRPDELPSERHTTQCLLDKGKPVVRRGRKAMGLNRSEGGTDKAARLPKGWTGPVSTSGTQATQVAWVFFRARRRFVPFPRPFHRPSGHDSLMAGPDPTPSRT